jgi:two-component sensor histidine kinase
LPDIVTGRVDLAGQLIAADERLLRLQEQAGGELGQAFAIPALAGVVRLAQTLGVLISRSVTCASGDHDLELLVRANPDNKGVAVTIAGWTPRPLRKPWLPPQNIPVLISDTFEKWNWVTNAKLEITEASGKAGTELTGLTLTQIFRLTENEFDQMPILAASASGIDFADQPAVMRTRPDCEVSLSGGVLRDAQGVFAGFAGSTETRSVRPVTDRVPEPVTGTGAGADFTKKLDAALRVPLRRIVVSADSISAQTDGPLRRDYADYAGDIANAARHLLALVDDLSDLQAVEQPHFHIVAEEIDLADLARRAAGLLKVRAGNRQIRIDCPAADDILAAQGDYRRVLQILVNLIGNAIRYSPDDGMIWIRTERDADTAVLIVADQGKGIATADHTRIFDKFERVDPSEPGGSGLGLFISRRLAQAMGGDIVVDSAPGQGARFILTLPAA